MTQAIATFLFFAVFILLFIALTLYISATVYSFYKNIKKNKGDS